MSKREMVETKKYVGKPNLFLVWSLSSIFFPKIFDWKEDLFCIIPHRSAWNLLSLFLYPLSFLPSVRLSWPLCPYVFSLDCKDSLPHIDQPLFTLRIFPHLWLAPGKHLVLSPVYCNPPSVDLQTSLCLCSYTYDTPTCENDAWILISLSTISNQLA